MKSLSPWIFLLLMVIISTSACKKEKSVADFAGNWSGVYSGDDSGVWNATITEEGKASGIVTSNLLPNYPFNLSGSINMDGDFQSTIIVLTDTLIFKGKLVNKDATGTWISKGNQMNGTWSGSRN